MTLFIGVDPGLHGAVAILDQAGAVVLVAAPGQARRSRRSATDRGVRPPCVRRQGGSMSANPVTPAPFNWKNPNYLPVFQARTERLRRLRANREMLPALHHYYAEHPAQFISDWGLTLDPRNVERGLPTAIPFLLFPRQVEWVTWLLERWHAGEPGITEKTRDMGMSWLTVAVACTFCLFNRGMVIGFGSRKEEYVDMRGSPKALFEKARFFLSHLPPEFLGGWDRDKHAPHMRILFPGTDSAMTGESGDGIGRGDRTSIYFVDEAAFLERPQLVDASLSATTNCRQDISTPNGRSNSFATRRHSGKIPVFSFHWTQDPRKDRAWYEKQIAELDPVTVAQEIDIDYSGSVEGVLIPSAWVQAAVGAHLTLGIEPTGSKHGALDVADLGSDMCAFAGRHGIVLEYAKSWSGKGSHIYNTVVRAFGICDEMGYDSFFYDADGLGAGVRGDADRLREDREASSQRYISDQPFRGSGAVWSPDGEMVRKRKNKDFFANAKAQAWWSLRLRFEATYRAVVEGMPYVKDDLVSIDPKCGELLPLLLELSQPTYSINSVGKVLVDKQPDGTRSPNLADAVMIAFQPATNIAALWARLGE
jgi:phage terminase large subunit